MKSMSISQILLVIILLLLSTLSFAQLRLKGVVKI